MSPSEHGDDLEYKKVTAALSVSSVLLTIISIQNHLTTTNTTTVPTTAFNMPSTKFLSLLALAASTIAV